MLILLRTYFISFIGTLFLCLSPFAFATQPKIAIVLNSGEATVSLIDMATRKVTKTFYVGKEPHHLMMTPDEKTLLVANAVGDDIALLNPLSGEITGRIPKIIDPYQIGYSPNHKWFVANGNRLDRVDVYHAQGADRGYAQAAYGADRSAQETGHPRRRRGHGRRLRASALHRGPRGRRHGGRRNWPQCSACHPRTT